MNNILYNYIYIYIYIYKSSTSIKLLPNIELARTRVSDSEDYTGIDDIDGVEIMLLY